MIQQSLFDEGVDRAVKPFKNQLLKWVGNKQRFAHEIAANFPPSYHRYIEPFVGSGAVLGTLAAPDALAGDVFKPLIEIWQTLQSAPGDVKQWYLEHWERMRAGDKATVYAEVKAAYNRQPNPRDLLFISRTCYGGVVRFRKADGFISTPCGVHSPMPPAKFFQRVDEWHRRVAGTTFTCADFETTMALAKAGDLIYCDPPYSDSQTILYGAQGFDLRRLFKAIATCKNRGVYIALSIDGTKRSGDKLCDVSIPDYLFAREAYVNCGRSMLRRFQMAGQSLEAEVVHDRLLLTY